MTGRFGLLDNEGESRRSETLLEEVDSHLPEDLSAENRMRPVRSNRAYRMGSDVNRQPQVEIEDTEM